MLSIFFLIKTGFRVSLWWPHYAQPREVLVLVLGISQFHIFTDNQMISYKRQQDRSVKIMTLFWSEMVNISPSEQEDVAH